MLRKKSFILLSTLSIALSSTASFANSANASLITLPELHPGFKFNLAILALQPGASNLNYVIYNKELPAQSPTWEEKEISPGFSPAFELGASYVYPTGKDVSLDWTHLNSSSNASTTAPDASYFLGPDYEIGPDAIPIRNAKGNAQFKYDVINLSAGQTINFGSHVETRFFIGLSNANLREQVRTTYSGNTITGPYQGPFSTQQTVTANFYGLGPRLGVEASYNTEAGFGFFGEGAASALIGSIQSKTAYVSSAQELKVLFNQDSNYQTIKDQNVTQVIPGFDAKLGVNYKHMLSRGTLFTIAAGYQGAVYINAISQYLPGTLVEAMDTGGIYVATMNHTLSNYSVQGPFLQATLEV